MALLIVDHNMTEMPGVDFLARAHEMHPLAKRVLLVERDYSARSPVVQAMTLGQADYHITKPWMLEQDLYREISEFLAEWAKDQEAGFELFHVIGRLHDRSTHELRELLTRFNVPFGFHAVDSEQGRHLLENKGLDASRLPVMIRHDDYTMVEPTPAQIIEAVGVSISQRRRRMRCRHRRSGTGRSDCRRLRRIRRPADGRAGRDRVRRPGGKQPDDPQLSGLPARHQRT